MNKTLLGRYDIYAIILLTFSLRYFQIFTIEYPNGWDGCFYEMQLDCWLKSGVIHSPNYSLIYFLLKPLTWLSTPAIAYKAVAVIASASFSILIAIYLRKVSGRLESIAVWLLTLSSPLLLFMSHQFTKNLLGLDILILYFIMDRKWWRTVVLLALAFFTHRVAFVILMVLTAWDLSMVLNKRQMVYLTLTGSAGAMMLSFIPGLPNFLDYLRILEGFELTTQWAPLAFYKVWSSVSFGFVWYLETMVVHGILLIGGYFAWKQKKVLALLLVILLLIIPIYEFSTGSLGYRLYLNAFCLLFLLTPLVFRLAHAQKIIFAAAMVSLPFSIFSYQSKKFDPPIDSYKMIADRVNQALEHTDSVSLVIAHKGIKEQIILRTEFDALNWSIHDTMVDSTCFRVVHGLTDSEIIELQGNEQKAWQKLSKSYFLTKESNWRQLLIALEEEGQYSRIKELQSWLNPYELRPQYLR